MSFIRIILLSSALLCSVSASADEVPTFELTARNGYFIPETIEVPAGKRFKIAIRNEGPSPEEFESLELHKEVVLAAGVTRTVVFMPMRPGVYQFIGEFHPETAKGQLVVK